MAGVELEYETRGTGEPVVLAHALQLALDAPEVVASLTLLEPALMAVPSRAAWGQAVAVPAVERHRAGDTAQAIDIWMRGVAGPGYRTVLDDVLPGAFDQAVADADTFFGQELPALQRWSFTKQDAARITQPVLAVLGGASHQVSPVWGERQALLLDWLGDVEPFVLPGATHLLHLQQPAAMAEGLAGFLGRTPSLATASGARRGPCPGGRPPRPGSTGRRERQGRGPSSRRGCSARR